MEAAFSALGLLADVGVDGWLGTSFIATHPSTHAVHDSVEGLSKAWNPTGEIRSDKVSLSHADLADIGKSLKSLQQDKLSQSQRRQLEANVSLAMRRYVNPHARQLDSLNDYIKTKIRKRESSYKRNGVLSLKEHGELQKLYKASDGLALLRAQAHEYQRTFNDIDADSKIFTTGQKFRRDSLNVLHSLVRFNSRHRILVASTATAILILATIASYMNQQAVVKAAKQKNASS